MTSSRPGAVKSPKILAYHDALRRISDDDAAIVRQYVSAVNEEAGFWRLRFRAAQEQLEASRKDHP